MRKSKNNIVHLGQRLLVENGTRTSKSGKIKRAWEDLGFFPSRLLAQKAAQERRPGKKYHIEGQRFDTGPFSANNSKAE